MTDFIPKIALAYIKNKKLTPAFSYKDVWHEEHATGFTAAKAMQINILADLHDAVANAIENGQSFDSFRKNIKPLLQQKGWWGKREMIDPLTGKTVNAQLGSGHRLKTIYRVNMRSDLYPTPTKKNNTNKPCRAICIPPASDGSGGGTLPIKTETPPTKYKTYFNERKGTFERVPECVDPAFNWNVGRIGRSVSAYENLVQKTLEKDPEQFDLIMSSIMKNKINKACFYSFIEDALERKKDRQHTAPVGFLDSKITNFLAKKGVNLGEHTIVMLESKLVNGKKYTGKHTAMGNAPTKEDWYNLLDWMLDAAVYWDTEHNGLLYLVKLTESRYMKFAVDLSLATEKHRGVRLLLPKIDTMFILDLSVESSRGIDEYNRISKLQKIR